MQKFQSNSFKQINGTLTSISLNFNCSFPKVLLNQNVVLKVLSSWIYRHVVRWKYKTFPRKMSPPTSRQKNKRSNSQDKPGYVLHAGSFAWFIFRLWRWRQYVPPKRQLNFNRLQIVISKKIKFFITTSMKTSVPTKYIMVFLLYAIYIVIPSQLPYFI
jgi:hypothetical protein